MRVFVYGSLKRGQSNHAAYMAGQTYLGPARTLPAFRLYDLGQYPGLVACANGVAIEGELWEVDAECLRRLDQLESIDVGEYERQRVRLAEPPVEAWIYLYCGDITGARDCGPAWPAPPI